MSDFTNIMANGKIAMKLNEGDELVRVRTCTDDDTILLATKRGMCIRFPVPDVRVFSGRTSTGVRGIRLDEGDEVIWMSALVQVDIDTEQRDAYLRQANALRRAADMEDEEASDAGLPGQLPQDVFDMLAAREQFVLTVTEKGFGKRTSAYDYRTTNRGGKGIVNVDIAKRNDQVVATFPVEPSDQIMLVTDSGQVIRFPVDQVRIAGRRTQGVTLFDVDGEGKVVSVARLRDMGDDEVEDGVEAIAGADDSAESGTENGTAEDS